MVSKEDKLFEGFEPVSFEKWRSQVEKDLKGRPYESLIIKDLDRLRIDPIFFPESMKYEKSSAASVSGNHWRIVQEIKPGRMDQCELFITNAAEMGIDTLEIDFMREGELDPLFATYGHVNTFLNAHPELSQEMVLKSGAYSFTVFAAWVKWHSENKKPLGKGKIDNDPFERFALTGESTKVDTESMLCSASIIHWCSQNAPSFKSLQISGEWVSLGGGSVAQELAVVLSMCADYISCYKSLGISEIDIFKAMHFKFAVGTDFFHEIGKFRAFRVLWDRFQSFYKVEKQDATLHARSSVFVFGDTGTQSNMLRGTTMAMSAAMGGVDSVSVVPYNVFGQDVLDFSSTVCKNIQLVLKNEAYFDQVNDPLAGSGFVENLTYQLVEKAWSLFVDWEGKGGFLTLFRAGEIQKEIESKWNDQKKEINQRKRVFVGSNKYFSVGDFSESQLQPVDTQSPKQLSEDKSEFYPDAGLKMLESFIEKISFDTSLKKYDSVKRGKDTEFVPFRHAVADFSRIQYQNHLKKDSKGHFPRIDLVLFGSKGMQRARKQFSQILFESAAFEVEILDLNQGTDPLDPAMDPQPGIFVLCSSDEDYAKKGIEILPKLKSTYPNCQIILAGKQKDLAYWKQRGVDHFIYQGMDCIAFFDRLMNQKEGK